MTGDAGQAEDAFLIRLQGNDNVVAANGGTAIGRIEQLITIINGIEKKPASLKEKDLRDYLEALSDDDRVALTHSQRQAAPGKFQPDARRENRAPRLQQVYIDRPAILQERTQQQDQESKVKPCLDHLLEHRQCVVTAGPGMGKTFLLRWLAMEFLQEHPHSPSGRTGVPVTIPLRFFAPWLEIHLKDKDTAIQTNALWQFLGEQWAKESYTDLARGLADWLDSQPDLAAPHVVLLFDGLDEVPETKGLRASVARLLEALAKRHQALRIVVTSRSGSYALGKTPRPWLLRKARQGGALWPVIQLPLFSPAEIDTYASNWFHELAAQQHFSLAAAEHKIETFREAIADQDSLQDMAATPLTLTMLCLLHGAEREMPKHRADLFHRMIKLSLGEWEKDREEVAARGGKPSADGTRFEGLCRRPRDFGHVELNTDRLIDGLAELLYSLVADQVSRDAPAQDYGIVLPRKRLRLMFAALFEGRSLEHVESDEEPALLPAAFHWADDMIHFVHEQGGLMDAWRGADSDFVFPHRQYGEFLAGYYLAKVRLKDSERLLLDLCPSLAMWDDVWREPILLGASWLVSQHALDFLEGWVEAFCQAPDEEDPERLFIAASILAELRDTPFGSPSGRKFVVAMRTALTERMTAPSISLPLRSRLGSALAELGDTRSGVRCTEIAQQLLPDFSWSEPLFPGADGFRMGSDERDSEAYKYEKPPFQCTLIRASYRTSLYPVTVAQYKAFVRARGYEAANERWWTEAGLAWKRRNDIHGPEYFRYGNAFQAANVPVTGVSFHEAVAFCRWLRELGERCPNLPNAEHYRQARLPTEMEWEFAARGNDQRLFPWGNASQNRGEHCNMADSGIGHPSAVGLFGKDNTSPCGAHDLLGNVWEWTCSKWTSNYQAYRGESSEDTNDARVFRGGSFGHQTYSARAAARSNYNQPGDRYSGVGFRVVSSPFFP